MFTVHKKNLFGILLVSALACTPSIFAMKKKIVSLGEASLQKLKKALQNINTNVKNQKVENAMKEAYKSITEDDDTLKFFKQLPILEKNLSEEDYTKKVHMLLQCALVNNKLNGANILYDRHQLNINAINKEGDTLLHTTIFHTDQFDERYENSGGNIRWIISKNPDINLKSNGDNVLSLAATKKTKNLFEYLIQHGAKIIISNPTEQEMFEYLKWNEISDKTIKKLLYYYYMIEDADKFDCNDQDFFDCEFNYL